MVTLGKTLLLVLSVICQENRKLFKKNKKKIRNEKVVIPRRGRGDQEKARMRGSFSFRMQSKKLLNIRSQIRGNKDRRASEGWHLGLL